MKNLPEIDLDADIERLSQILKSYRELVAPYLEFTTHPMVSVSSSEVTTFIDKISELIKLSESALTTLMNFRDHHTE